jgi:hypothetical protein
MVIHKNSFDPMLAASLCHGYAMVTIIAQREGVMIQSAVAANIPMGEEVQFSSFNGAIDRDWSGVVAIGGPMKSDRMRHLLAVDYAAEVAERATFKTAPLK